MAVDTDESPNADSSQSSGSPLALLDPVRTSFSLQLAAVGVAFIAIGFALGSGVWAGMLPIWGSAFVLIGLGAYAFTALSQRGTKG
ncbi:hypothetical protein [Halosimplex salinum]|uniref:hypothetical protein n=1 Tax=Halosimplex salinum TaxID=1710538 RepID=UPI000F49ED73|nr:hypothetical protein [Halosimplex salinum]